jgi:hypothetical protein
LEALAKVARWSTRCLHLKIAAKADELLAKVSNLTTLKDITGSKQTIGFVLLEQKLTGSGAHVGEFQAMNKRIRWWHHTFMVAEPRYFLSVRGD